jgi:hypothetical protein
MKEQELKKMELLITLNDNFVVQRFFNVREYQENAGRSLNLYHEMNNIKEIIQNDLKRKTLVYMTDNYFQIITDESIMETSNTDGPENFNIYIKDGNRTICHLQFDAKVYPPKVRYTVDIRPLLKGVLRNLTDIFSDEKLTYTYLDLELA